MEEYDKWNNLKQTLAKGERRYFEKGDVWFASIGKNLGDEEDGKNDNYERPIVIIRKFNNSLFLAVPLTSQNKDGKYYQKLHSFISTAILSQVRLLDAKRLLRKVGRVEHLELQELKRNVKDLI